MSDFRCLLRRGALVALVWALAGCGGGDGAMGAGNATASGAADQGSATDIAAPARVVVNATIASAAAVNGTLPLNLSAVVVDVNSVAVPNVNVAFLVQDPANGVVLQAVQPRTDATGTAAAILSLVSAGQTLARTVTVTAQAGAVVSNPLRVTVQGGAFPTAPLTSN